MSLLRCLRVGQKWLDPDDGKPVTVLALDEGTEYPVLFSWGTRGGDMGRATAEGFIRDYQPADLAAFLTELLDAIDRRTPAAPPEPLTAKAGLDEADCEGLPEEDGKYHHCPGCAATPGTAPIPPSEPIGCKCGKPWSSALHGPQRCTWLAGTPRGDE